MFSILVEKSENGCIGVGKNKPWFIPTAYKQWRKLTKKKTLIVGRETFETLPRRYTRNRHFWVLSRNKLFRTRKGVVFNSFETLLEEAEKYASLKEFIVIGGAEMYRKFVPLAVKFYFLDVKGSYYGDAYFPENEYSSIKTKLMEEVEFSTHHLRILHKIMVSPYYLLQYGKIPPSQTKSKWRKYQRHFNRTTRRKKDRARRKAEREIFEFEFFPKGTREKRLPKHSVSDYFDIDPTKKVIKKRRIRGRPRKIRLVTEERRAELKARLNITLKEIMINKSEKTKA